MRWTSARRSRSRAYSDETPAALLSVPERRRVAGTIHAFDTWRLHRRAVVTYGTRYAYHDYLDRPTLLSPSVSMSVSPIDKTWVRVAVTQQMLAPGAEEFDARNLSAFSMPPQRTFTSAAAGGRLSAERTRHLEIGLERQVGQFLVGVRRFEQAVDNQLVAMFGVGPQGAGARPRTLRRGQRRQRQRRRLGRRHRPGRRSALPRRGRVHRGAGAVVRHRRPRRDSRHGAVGRPPRQRADPRRDGASRHRRPRDGDPRRGDVEGQLRILAPQPAARRCQHATPASTSRSSQRLPFLSATGADWEFVVAVRNLFRDGEAVGSIYDELLVIRPPKRVVGGVLVKF